jgi:zinc transport system ATP-binding protein
MTYDVEAENLSFDYGGAPVLTGASFAVPRGEFLAVIGPNGGGKTTLLKILLGLLEPRRGRVRVLGVAPREAARRVGYVPQDVSTGKDFPISVLDAVCMGRLPFPMGRPSREDRAKAREALDRLGLADRAEERIGCLSQGQRQRVLIARALAGEPELLFLDEPTASVDGATQASLHDLLRELNRTVTILMVSHDLTAVSACATAVACVNRTVHYHGSAEVTPEMLTLAYGACPVDLIAHGLPHRVLRTHDERCPGEEQG